MREHFSWKLQTEIRNRNCESSYIEHGDSNPVFDQWGELPLLPFGNPIGFVPASRGGVCLKSLH